MPSIATISLIAVLTLPASASTHAVIPGCCAQITGSVTVMDASTGAIAGAFSTGVTATGYGVSQSYALTKGGNTLAVLNNDYPSSGPQAIAVTLIGLTTGKPIGSVNTPGALGQSMAVNSQSGAVYAAYQETTHYGLLVQTVDPGALKVVRTQALAGAPRAGLAVSPDGNRIYIPTSEGVVVMRATTLEVLGTVSLPGPAFALAVSPDSATLYATYASSSGGYYADSVAFIDAATLQFTQTAAIGAFFSFIALSPDGTQIYLSGLTALWVLDAQTLALSSAPIVAGKIAVAPEGTLYAEYVSGIAVVDPASLSVVSVLAAENVTDFALSAGAASLYIFANQSSAVAITGAVPTVAIARSTAMGVVFGMGAYDAVRQVVLLPNLTGNIDVLDSHTLRPRGFVNLGSPAYWTVSGDSDYAVSGQPGYAPGPLVTRFDPSTFQITGSVGIPYPSSDNSAVYFQPVLYGKYLYVPFHFYFVDCCGQGIPASHDEIGIAIVDTSSMELAGAFHYSASGIFGFAITPATGKGYIATSGQLREIDLQTGAVLRTAAIPNSGYLAASPDGKTIYVSTSYPTAGELYAISTQTLTIGNSTSGLYFSYPSLTPDGQYIYGSTNSGVSIVSTTSLAVVGSIPSHGYVGPGPVLFTQD